MLNWYRNYLSIFNDTGTEGTTNLPQNTPEDFTLGVRN